MRGWSTILEPVVPHKQKDAAVKQKYSQVTNFAMVHGLMKLFPNWNFLTIYCFLCCSTDMGRAVDSLIIMLGLY